MDNIDEVSYWYLIDFLNFSDSRDTIKNYLESAMAKGVFTSYLTSRGRNFELNFHNLRQTASGEQRKAGLPLSIAKILLNYHLTNLANLNQLCSLKIITGKGTPDKPAQLQKLQSYAKTDLGLYIRDIQFDGGAFTIRIDSNNTQKILNFPRKNQDHDHENNLYEQTPSPQLK